MHCAPAVAEELAARAPSDAPLNSGQQVGCWHREGIGGKGSLEQLAYCDAFLVRVFIVGRFAHPIFSPKAFSTMSLSCARARWIRLLTVPSASPVIAPISS